jgi:hypothetical protein
VAIGRLNHQGLGVVSLVVGHWAKGCAVAQEKDHAAVGVHTWHSNLGLET